MPRTGSYPVRAVITDRLPGLLKGETNAIQKLNTKISFTPSLQAWSQNDIIERRHPGAPRLEFEQLSRNISTLTQSDTQNSWLQTG